jgi:hypothetical protein
MTLDGRLLSKSIVRGAGRTFVFIFRDKRPCRNSFIVGIEHRFVLLCVNAEFGK